MPGTNKMFGNPSGIPFISTNVDAAALVGAVGAQGGRVQLEVAAGTLNYGDIVYRSVSGRVEKSLEVSLYPAWFVGVVVGGASTNYQATNDSSLIGTSMSTIGQTVVVQVDGMAYVAQDSTAVIQVGHQIYPGQTTAGRVLGGSSAPSYATNPGGMVIKSGASALTKSAKAMSTIVSGAPGTATAANLDAAAFSGTTANLAYALYVFRVATDGTTVTTAKSADAATLSAIVWPTAGASTVLTYGAVLIHPTGVGGFVGGTTALDDATVIPNAIYYDIWAKRRSLGVCVSISGSAAGTAFLMQIDAY